MRHHTKDKGDSGLGYMIADLLSNGIQVELPISEHLSFDCIAISTKNILKRVSVKYRQKSKNGSLEVSLKSCWSDRNGNHIRCHDKNSYDVTAIYCPDTGECYYLNNNEIKKVIILRIDEPKNCQKTGIKFAREYRSPNRMFIKMK